MRRIISLLLMACFGLSAVAHGQTARPDPLLAVDQNRATVIARVVGDWGEALGSSGAGLDAAQLREMLWNLRADQLLAASLAGSLSGLRDVLANAIAPMMLAPAKGWVAAKDLGEPGQDVVYVPVTPCRLVDTRAPLPAVYQGAGPFVAGELRNYTVQGGNGVCLSQLPGGLSAAAVQLQVFGMPADGISGDIEVLAQGSTFGSTATLVFVGSNPFTSAGTTTRINAVNNQIAVQVRGAGAHLAMDVVGYFRPPPGGYVASVTKGTGIDVGGTAINPTVAIADGYRLPQVCTNGQVAQWNGSSWACAAVGGTGTVTSVGTGAGLTGGPITTIGTIAADTTYLQRRISGGCAAGSSIRTINPDGTVVCEADDAGPANAYVQGGNTFGAPAVIGTIDVQPMTVQSAGGSVRLDVGAGNGIRVDRTSGGFTDAPNLVAGSANNSAIGQAATVAGGGAAGSNCFNPSTGIANRSCGNVAQSNFASVGGGYSNAASGNHSTVSGGYINTSSSSYAIVGGGYLNIAGGYTSSVLGGFTNSATGSFATVPGGYGNLAQGGYSLAAGRRARAYNSGCFVWGDGVDQDVACSTDNAWVARATGGVAFWTNAALTTGCSLSPGGGGWNCTSTRAEKRDFAMVDPVSVLERIVALPIAAWRFRDERSGARHMGPMAEDFHAAFGLGDSDRTIGSGDAQGVSLAAIQGLNRKFEERDAALRNGMRARDAEIAALREESALLRQEIANLHRAIVALTTNASPDGLELKFH